MTDRDDRTELTLSHDNNDFEEARDHSEENWEMVLSNLKELLETYCSVRTTEPRRPNRVPATWSPITATEHTDGFNGDSPEVAPGV